MATMKNGTPNSLPKSQIEAAQSVVPIKMTDPRLSRRVSVTDSGIFQSWFHIIFYYNKVSGEDSGWSLAGWTKESLGRALHEQPMLGGRLRREEESEGGLELVSNDCGIRLFEARISKTVAEFLDLEEREDAEAELLYWKDIDEENPQFSPLFYAQVTNFHCGGYSVGISCSLVLADPLAIISFLRRWANIHSRMVSETEMAKPPLFYLPNFKPNASSLTNQAGSNQIKDRRKPLIFRTGKINHNEVDKRKALALRCIEEAELKLGGKRASKITLLVKKPSEEIEVESYLREGLMEKQLSFRSGLNCGSWDDLGASEVKFCEGKKPVCVSYWISCVPGEGLLVLIPSPDESASETLSVVVTAP
ncbi:hypothetical protein RHSIM_Rhsim07G0118000 [Rhododendron simsii]|uniref:Uncharacterized protein n=1 Tax=Rhododendron simsii TaxID=118357 RepID=A0A834GTF6_RHOSS|nr:hypothetical protein RHSIM_Rhsim07G0118000 [Rhododendron simsii]